MTIPASMCLGLQNDDLRTAAAADHISGVDTEHLHLGTRGKTPHLQRIAFFAFGQRFLRYQEDAIATGIIAQPHRADPK